MTGINVRRMRRVIERSTCEYFYLTEQDTSTQGSNIA